MQDGEPKEMTNMVNPTWLTQGCDEDDIVNPRG